jgi:hypothetical protein
MSIGYSVANQVLTAGGKIFTRASAVLSTVALGALPKLVIVRIAGLGVGLPALLAAWSVRIVKGATAAIAGSSGAVAVSLSLIASLRRSTASVLAVACNGVSSAARFGAKGAAALSASVLNAASLMKARAAASVAILLNALGAFYSLFTTVPPLASPRVVFTVTLDEGMTLSSSVMDTALRFSAALDAGDPFDTRL